MYTIAIKKNDNQNFLSKALIILLGCFFIYLLVISGPYGYKVFWLFIYPPAAFYLIDRKLASLFTGIFFMIALTFLLFQEHFPLVYQYDAEFKFIFLSSLFIIGLISFVFESTKCRYQQDIETNKLLLTQERNKVIEAEKSIIVEPDSNYQWKIERSNQLILLFLLT